MHFDFDGKKFRIRFQYHSEATLKTKRFRLYSTVYSVVATTTIRSVDCILEEFSQYSDRWIEVDRRTSRCSQFDQFRRAIGREYALGRFKKLNIMTSEDQGPAFYAAMLQAYKDRRKQPAKTSKAKAFLSDEELEKRIDQRAAYADNARLVTLEGRETHGY
jgi:hypothetical protein